MPWAKQTGNLTVQPFSVVHSVIYDEQKGKAVGVKVIDTNTKQATEYFANIIFVNASALNSNLILLNSISNRFPNGLGNDNGLLGKYICHHNYRAATAGTFEGYRDKYYKVGKPAECIIPNFRNVHKQDTDFVGGYVIFSGAGREKLSEKGIQPTIGADYKKAISEPGRWTAYMYMQGETIPKETNHVRLSKDKTDQWGIPLLITSVGYDDNDDKMVKDFLEQGKVMLEAAGATITDEYDNHQAPGLDIHEMGGVRMGRDPKTSLLNEWNQLHQCKNVFVTDGACMTSTGNTEKDISFFDELAETILPKTGTPGAKDAEVGKFMASYSTDCYDEVQLKTLKEGINKLNGAAEKKYGNDFMQINASQRQELLTGIDAEAKEYNNKKDKEHTPHYFTLMKQMTLLGFFTSKPGASQVLRYVPVPGKYQGCIDYKKGETSWA